MSDQANKENEMSKSVVLPPPAKTEAITLDESQRFIELEKIIAAGKQTFIEVGKALAEIRDARLYHSDFSTFEEYCDKKWGFTKQHAYRLIACAPIAKSNPQVTSLNQARALAKVPEKQRPAVIQAAAGKAESDGRELTAKVISEVAASPEYKTVVDREKAVPEVIRPQAKIRHPALKLQWWYSKATPQKRGQFVNSVLSLPVQTDDLADFKKRASHWLEHLVSEAKR